MVYALAKIESMEEKTEEMPKGKTLRWQWEKLAKAKSREEG